MDEEVLESFDGKINVEVSVTSGGVSAVSFTTVIKLDPTDKKQAQARLRDIASLLRAALPFEELKSEEHEFNDKQTAPVGVTANGPVTKQEVLVQSVQKIAESCKPEGKT
jgi:hypothetical protein